MIKIKLSFYIFLILLSVTVYAQEQGSNSGSVGIITASAQTYRDEPEDIFLSVKYSGVVDTTISAIYFNSKIYLPLRTMLKMFKIPFNEEDKRISFAFPSDSKTGLNIEAGKIDFTDSVVMLIKENFFLRPDDIYLEDEILEKILSIGIVFSFNDLSVKIESEQYLPIYQEYLREQKYRFFQKGKEAAGPLLYPLEKDWIAGGVLDYQVSSNYTGGNSPYYNYQVNFGGEIAGGELRTGLNGSIINNNNNVDNFNYLWDYVFNKNYLTRISIGDQYINGLNSYSARTLTLTNEPVSPRRIYNLISLDGSASPFSTVEMYTNDRLSDFVHTDANGIYNFSIPLTYGTTIAKVITYDKEGNVNEIRRLFQIPPDFIPEGELDYKFSIGRQTDSKNIFSLATASMGVTSRLSNTTGIEYLQDSNNKNPALFNSLKARFFSDLLLDLTLAPSVSYSVSLNSILPDLQTFSLQLKRYEKNLFYNPTSIKNEATANLYFPFHFKYPLNFGFSGRFSEYEKINSYEYKIEADGDFDNFHPTVAFRQLFIENAYIRSSIEGGFLLTIPQIQKIWGLLQGNLLSLKTSYNVQSQKFENLYLIFASTFYKYLRFQLSYMNSFSAGGGSFQFRLITELPFTRSTTSASENTFSQSLQGSINYDMPNGRFYFYNRMNSGKASAVINMFVDRNNDGKYEPGEEKVDGKVNLEGASNVLNYNGNLYFNDLTPYTKYSLTVDENSIKNPLLKPLIKTFTFIAGPNRVTQIDIPFYVAGEISGNIVTRVSSANPGRFQVFAEDSAKFITKIRTFGDGSFYYFGLKPGHYKIYINPAQLTGIKSAPKNFFVDIKPVESESSVSNLVFELK